MGLWHVSCTFSPRYNRGWNLKRHLLGQLANVDVRRSLLHE
jgi:hypothetical protein